MSLSVINFDLKNTNKLPGYLQSLNILVTQSSDINNSGIRDQFINKSPQCFFDEIISVIHQINTEFIEHNSSNNVDIIIKHWHLESLFLKLRIFRGLLIFVRNLLVFHDSFVISDLQMLNKCLMLIHTRLLQSFTILSSHKIMNQCDSLDSSPEIRNLQNFIIEKLSVSYFQCLNNLSGNLHQYSSNETAVTESISNKTADSNFNQLLTLISDMLVKSSQFPDNSLLFFNNLEYFNSFLTYINQFIINGDSIIYAQKDPVLTSNFVYHLLKNYNDPIILNKLSNWFLSIYQELYLNENQVTSSDYLNSNFLILSNIFKNILKHESLTTFISKNIESGKNLNLLTETSQISQILLSNINNYTKDDLMVVLTWISDFLKILVNKIGRYFTTAEKFEDGASETATFLNLNLYYLLDTLTHLITFNSVVELLNYYKFLDILIQLLKILQENIQPISKLSNSNNFDKNPIIFKNLKKLTIENMSYLIANNFENQELIRTSNCIEIILSNCIIDQVNPYIKETCIICIKYLMQDNPGNQKFVQLLEAKRVVNEDELNEKGIEVEIIDGKVQFKTERDERN